MKIKRLKEVVTLMFRDKFEMYLKEIYDYDYYVFEIIKFLENTFMQWVNQNKFQTIEGLTKQDILSYVEHEQNKEVPNTQQTINKKLIYIRKYYDFLIYKGLIQTNPAKNIIIGRKQKQVVMGPLNDKELTTLYEMYVTYTNEQIYGPNFKKEYVEFIKQRNILIISLVIYQAMDTGELDRLHVTDIRFDNGTIMVSGKNKRNSRYLKLEPQQVFMLLNYINSLPDNQEKLFDFSMVNQGFIYGKVLRSLNPQCKNLGHVRKSRIISWTKTLELRDVQYMTGHKCVSSTEYYQSQNTDELSIRFNQIHLFG